MQEVLQKQRLSFAKSESDFFVSLRTSVNEYFKKNNISPTGNKALYAKAAFFLGSYILGYILLMAIDMNGYLAIGLCLLLGILAAGIGFNVMHDGGHGSFSKSGKWNTISAYSMNFLGGNAWLWNQKHNVIHHTYTNIDGHDQDIAQMPVLRLSSLQKKFGFHRFQHLYCIPVYGLSSMLWVFILDYMKYFGGKVGELSTPKLSVKEHADFWFWKVFYVVFYVGIPIWIWGFKAAAIGFLAYHVIFGIILSLVFQLAHVVENTEFTHDHLHFSKIQDEWSIHQLKTTANFDVNNKLLSWYVGGLNYQVTHHLFPKISHVHYPAINNIIKEKCKEFNIVYNEFETTMDAIKSHLGYMKKMATE